MTPSSSSPNNNNNNENTIDTMITTTPVPTVVSSSHFPSSVPSISPSFLSASNLLHYILCFPRSSTVRVLNDIDDTDTIMPLSKIQIGDRVLVHNDDDNSNNSIISALFCCAKMWMLQQPFVVRILFLSIGTVMALFFHILEVC